jgi:hypothetical protein
MGEKKDPPSLLQRGVNFTKSMAKVATHAVLEGQLQVEDEEYEDRMEICKGCTTYFKESTTTCEHPECGCFMPVKARLAAMTCPLLMWPGDMEKMEDEGEYDG